jgi:cytochrome c5
MKTPLILLSATALAGSMMTSCETAPAKPSADTAGVTAGSAEPDGRKIYFGRCTSCHAADPVSDYTRSEWHGIIAEMAPKAKLSGAERSALTAYIMDHAPAT